MDRRRQGRLVNWVEKARLEHLRRLFEISERERHHKLLLYVKNMHELGASLFPYIVHFLPRPLPSKVIKGKHFILPNLLKSLSGGSSHAEAALEPLVQPDHLPLAMQDPKHVPLAEKKKRKKRKTG